MDELLWSTFLFTSLGLVVFLVVLSAIVRSFIGLQISFGRILVAAAVGIGLQYLMQTQVTWRSGQYGPAMVALQFGLLAFFSTVFLVISELLVPNGSIPPISDWRRTLRRWLVHSRRSAQIMQIMMGHGLNPLSAQTRTAYQRTPRRQARQVRLALQEAGATFVKLGQVLSTRPDLLPPEYIRELSQLQQNVAPAPWSDIRQVLREELGEDVESKFADFEHEPLASASIGQVHRATLPDGRPVVVKVQRPGISDVVEDDLGITVQLGKTMQSRSEWGQNMGVAALTEAFADALREEMDFSTEARNIADLRAALARHPEEERLVVPDFIPELSTERVLTMQELAGLTLSQPEAAEHLSPEERRSKAHLIFKSVLQQITVDGIFHADPHPGNIMLLDGGQLALIDCGSVGRIDRRLQEGVKQLILSVEYADPQQLTDALFETLGRPEYIDESELTRALGRFMVTGLRTEGRMQLGVFNELIRIVTMHGLRVPPELAAAFRSIATLEGTLALLDPDFDMMGQARQIASRQIEQEFSPLALRRSLEKELISVMPILRRLPRHVDQLASALGDGRMTLRMRLFADRRDRVILWQILNQVLLAFLGAVLGLISVQLVTSQGGPKFTDAFTLLQLLGYTAGMVSTILIFRVLLVIFKRDME